MHILKKKSWNNINDSNVLKHDLKLQNTIANFQLYLI